MCVTEVNILEFLNEGDKEYWEENNFSKKQNNQRATF